MERLTLVVPNGDIWLLDAIGTPKILVTESDDDYKYFKKLAKYEDLEERGKLLKLPNDFEKWCDKIGDYIWFITGGDIYPLLVLDIGFDANVNFAISTLDDDKDGDGLSFDFELKDLNKTVFLTKEEAEAALREMNERED